MLITVHSIKANRVPPYLLFVSESFLDHLTSDPKGCKASNSLLEPEKQ